MSANNKKYEIDMCNGTLLPKILLFAIPLMCSSILQLLFNAADIIVVGRFAGDNSLAAVGANTSLINLLTNLFIGLSVGANVMVAREYGSGREKEISRTIHTAMALSLVSGGLLLVIGVTFSRQLLILMQTPEGILPLATVYLRILFLGMPANMVYNFGSAVLRAKGDTKRPLYYLMIAGVVNVFVNLLLVIVFHMDVAGVAIATVLSQCISAILVLRCMMKEEGCGKLVLSSLHLHKDKILGILRIGLPAGFQGIVFSLSNVVIQSSINSFGETVVAGNSAAANLEGFVYMGMNAFYQAAISFTGQNVGAGKKERIMKILLASEFCAIMTGLILGQAAVIWGRQLLGIYSSSPEVIEHGLVRLAYICGVYYLCGMMDTMVGILRGMGYAVIPMIMSLAGACGLRLIWLATVFQIERYHTVRTIYIAYPITWVVTFVGHLITFIIAYRKMMKKV